MDAFVAYVLRETGLEPARYYYHQALNLARLPIPPFPRREWGLATTPSFLRRSKSSQATSLARLTGVDSAVAATGWSRRAAPKSIIRATAASPPNVARLQARSPTGIQR
jgi:hypothetical protein